MPSVTITWPGADPEPTDGYVTKLSVTSMGNLLHNSASNVTSFTVTLPDGAKVHQETKQINSGVGSSWYAYDFIVGQPKPPATNLRAFSPQLLTIDGLVGGGSAIAVGSGDTYIMSDLEDFDPLPLHYGNDPSLVVWYTDLITNGTLTQEGGVVRPAVWAGNVTWDPTTGLFYCSFGSNPTFLQAAGLQNDYMDSIDLWAGISAGPIDMNVVETNTDAAPPTSPFLAAGGTIVIGGFRY